MKNVLINPNANEKTESDLTTDTNIMYIQLSLDPTVSTKCLAYYHEFFSASTFSCTATLDYLT